LELTKFRVYQNNTDFAGVSTNKEYVLANDKRAEFSTQLGFCIRATMEDEPNSNGLNIKQRRS
jgi:acyl-CoA thioesterase FadM